MNEVMLAIDLGTTGNRVIAFGHQGEQVAKSYRELHLEYPHPGWVEQNPAEIWETTKQALAEVIETVGAGQVNAIGITNQRETTILWNADSGEPVYNAIVWQCNRTAEWLESLKEQEPLVKQKTGLFLHPYFSASKIRWILDHVEKARELRDQGKLMFGTVDSWILWQLTGRKVHATEPSNACRTLLYSLEKQDYDQELIDLFGVGGVKLPEIKDSDGDFGKTDLAITEEAMAIRAILGDQQASLFAQSGFESGILKNTFGTGLFLMSATGDTLVETKELISTVAGKVGGRLIYALEGSVFIGGSVIQWLRDGLKLFDNAAESEEMALTLPDNQGVFLVPAFTGLGAPYWNPAAKGLLVGLTRGTTQEHLVRAALESIAYQTRDVYDVMKRLLPQTHFEYLAADGGATANRFLMQFVANLVQLPVKTSRIAESTALGAAGLAGITAGFWSHEEFRNITGAAETFSPQVNQWSADQLYHGWLEAVQRSF